MDSGWPILLVFALVAVSAAVIGSIQARRRRKELEAFARRVNFSFMHDAADWVADQFDGFTPFGQGRSRRVSNLLEGERAGVRWEMFDYRYTTGSGKNRRTHHYGVVAARIALAFPRTTIRPEGMFDKIASLAGFDDINFESEAFSRRYHVKSEDRRRIYDLVHPKMMEYLMSLPAMQWQLGPGLVLMVRGGHYDPPELERVMGAVEGFLAHIPGYVRAELTGTPR